MGSTASYTHFAQGFPQVEPLNPQGVFHLSTEISTGKGSAERGAEEERSGKHNPIRVPKMNAEARFQSGTPVRLGWITCFNVEL